MMRLLVATCVIVACAACQHVQLSSPPPASAGADALERYHAEVAPSRRATETTTKTWHDRGGDLQSTVNTLDVLVLESGAIVRYPEDLIPVVGATSTCGRTAGPAVYEPPAPPA